MKIYLVGGAVRDELLNFPVTERDWVVVGANATDMTRKRFIPVGKGFPVFLHPKTHEEYALARTEKKTGRGYKGFVIFASKYVTLEEDLKRRDLTINAMAKDEQGNIIDPFHGQDDLKRRVLRHTSSAFSEDPVRVLRVARFASRYGRFKVAPETNELMKTMVKNGEVSYLVPERVWQEFSRALAELYPWRFIEALNRCNALKAIFPEIEALFHVPESEKWHPEKNSGRHILLALKQAVRLTPDPMVRFAVLVHDLGKINSPKETLPKHHGHCEGGVDVVKKFCRTWRIPRAYEELAVLVTRYHLHCHKLMELNPSTTLKLIQALDPFRRQKRFEQFLLACQADATGRKGLEKTPYPQADWLNTLCKKCAEIDIQKIVKNLKPGKSIEEAIYNKRLAVVKQAIKTRGK